MAISISEILMARLMSEKASSSHEMAKLAT